MKTSLFVQALLKSIREERAEIRAGLGLEPGQAHVEEAAVLDIAAARLAAEGQKIDESILAIMWRMWVGQQWLYLPEKHYDAFSEWAFARFAPRYEDGRTLAKWIHICERILPVVYQRQWSDLPLRDAAGEVVTPERLLDTEGLFFKLDTVSALFAPDEGGAIRLSPDQQQEVIQAVLHETDREKLRDLKLRLLGGKPVEVFQWWEEPAGTSPQGEPLYRPIFPPMTLRQIRRLERRLGKTAQKMVGELALEDAAR